MGLLIRRSYEDTQKEVHVTTETEMRAMQLQATKRRGTLVAIRSQEEGRKFLPESLAEGRADA